MPQLGVKFYKLDELPATLDPNSIYFIANGEYAEHYVTDMSGASKKVGNTVMIQEVPKFINCGTF